MTVDVGLALLTYVATAHPWSLSRDRPWNVAATALAALPLIWRRQAPLRVTLLVGVGTIWLSMLESLDSVPFGQLLATYTVASLSPRRHRAIAVVLTLAGTVASLLSTAPTLGGVSTSAMSFVTVYSLGANARVRIALAEERGREERVTAAAAERARIARDMHDVLAHSVSLIVVQAEGGAAVVRRDPGRAEEAFDTIAGVGREALVQLRHSLGVLRADGDPDAGRGGGRGPQEGLDGVQALVESARSTGLDVQLVRDGAPAPVPVEVGRVAYRVVQESITNVIKHAGARRIEVSLRYGAGALEVRVRDDGRGATTGRDAVPGGAGQGLAGMATRVGECGGTLVAGPSSGVPGFQVAATLPLAAARGTTPRAPTGGPT